MAADAFEGGMSLIQRMDQFLLWDQPSSFFVFYRLQLLLACLVLLVTLVLAIYAFSAGDCFNPHTTMWRTQLLIDLLVALGFLLDAASAIRFQEPLLVLAAQSNLTSSSSSSSSSSSVSTGGFSVSSLLNSTVADCTAQRPYLFILLVCRQWTSVLALIVGLERLLFVRYPLWFKSIRIRKGPINVFTLFFALFSTGIAYTNSMYLSPDEPTHFSCEVSWAFGEDFGWVFFGLVIVPPLLGCLFCLIAAVFIRQDQALRHFGGNRTKVFSERRKIRKVKWVLLSSLLFVALPQLLLLYLRLVRPNGLFLLKLLVSQLFLLSVCANLAIYRLSARFTRGIIIMIGQWWKNRRKARVNPNDSVLTAPSHIAATRQN